MFFAYLENASLLRETGKWNFQCSDRNLSGTVSVVPSLHVISLAAKQLHNCYAIGVGDVVSWIDSNNHTNSHTCQKSIKIIKTSFNDVVTLNLTGKTYKLPNLKLNIVVCVCNFII